MKPKLIAFASIIIVGIASWNIWNLLNNDFVFSVNDHYSEDISVWITNSALIPVFNDFQIEENVQMNVRTFRDSDSILGALNLMSEEEAPDLIKMNSQMLNLEEIENLELQSISDNQLHKVHKAYDDLVADNQMFPLGITIPIAINNTTYLNNTDFPWLNPLNTQASLNQYEKTQKDIKNKFDLEQFWLFHTDLQSIGFWEEPNDFKVFWEAFVLNKNLIPPLESHMAITRFANKEVGVLLTTSDMLPTVQSSVGNSFEFAVYPRGENNEDIPVDLHGLIQLQESEAIDQLYAYLYQEEVQRQYLSRTGWLPVQVDKLSNFDFVSQLPMSKYLYPITLEQDRYVGTKRDPWVQQRIAEIKLEIEQSSGGD